MKIGSHGCMIADEGHIHLDCHRQKLCMLNDYAVKTITIGTDSKCVPK